MGCGVKSQRTVGILSFERTILRSDLFFDGGIAGFVSFPGWNLCSTVKSVKLT